MPLFAYILFMPLHKQKSAYMLLYALLFIRARLFLLKIELFQPFTNSYRNLAIVNIALSSFWYWLSLLSGI